MGCFFFPFNNLVFMLYDSFFNSFYSVQLSVWVLSRIRLLSRILTENFFFRGRFTRDYGIGIGKIGCMLFGITCYFLD